MLAEKIRRVLDRIRKMAVLAQPFLLLLFLVSFVGCVLVSTILFSDHFLPPPAAKPADGIVPLFNTTTAITGFTFFATQILLFFFAFRYRTKPQRQARFLKNYLKLELSWTITPALVFIGLFIWGQTIWAKMMTDPTGDVLDIAVMGAQFSWRVRYPGPDGKLGRYDFLQIKRDNPMGIDRQDPSGLDDFIPIQMHVPKNRTVRLQLRSRDVIHSFFIPHLRVKMDAVPGLVTTVHFTPTLTTTEMRAQLGDPAFEYEIACAELCGRLHFAMKMILVVDEPEEYEQWAARQQSWLTSHPEKPVVDDSPRRTRQHQGDLVSE